MFAKSNVRTALLAAGGLLVGLALAYGWSMPRATLTTPVITEDAATTTLIELRFSRAMQSDSVEAHFEIEPEVEGTFEWPDTRTLRFVPGEPLAANTEYTVRVKAGVRAANKIVGLRPIRKRFSTGQPAVVYLAEREGVVNLWRVEADGSGEQLSDVGVGRNVHSYGISRDGLRIALSIARADGGADLEAISRRGDDVESLLLCSDAACLFPAWSPNGRWVAYERRPLPEENSRGNVSSLVGEVWVLDTLNGETFPIVLREVEKGGAPLWSPDGTRLTFFEPGLQAIVLYEFGVDELQVVSNLTGQRITWAPDGQSIVYSEIFFSEEDGELLRRHSETHDPDTPHDEPEPAATYQHLVQYVPSSDSLSDLSGVLEVVDTTPTFSPDGQWVAFGRQSLGGGGTTPTFGRQLWLYDLQDESRSLLLDEPNFNHSAFAWSPDSRRIAYMSFDLLDPQSAAAVWIVDVASGDRVLAAEQAFLPNWLP